MALTRVTKGGITNDAVDGDKLKDGSITTAKIGASAIESSEINNGTVTVDDLANPLNLSSNTVTLPNTSVTAGMLAGTLDLSSKTVTLAGSTVESVKRPVQDNIALLGFKMAVNDGLTVFNLVDGIVDEFHDESGTDEGEGSNDLYNATDDFYVNSTQPQGVSACVSAGFTTTSVTEEDTSEAGTNPTGGTGTFGQFTVPSGVTALGIKAWGAGGSRFAAHGGGGGLTTGTLAVTASQVLEVVVGEAGSPASGNNGSNAADTYEALGGGGGAEISVPQGNLGAGGGGLSGVFTNSEGFPALKGNAPKAPQVYVVAGGGGGGGHGGSPKGGAGGGTSGQDATQASGQGGEGGSQTAGGASYAPCATPANASGFLEGADSGRNPRPSSPQVSNGAGGSGYYGGGGGGPQSYGESTGSGGGGSSYFGHPQITSGATEGGNYCEGGGTADPSYVACTNEGGFPNPGPAPGEDGYVLLTASLPASTTSTVIVSNAFAAGSVPTTSRIVVFEENVATPTLNTDIIASISRDGGSNFTAATLADSGYVTGASGQRILTGQATISGQPSGQSMRWKLALANNTVKIHGVALQWS